MSRLLGLLFALFVALAILGLAATGEPGQADTTRTEFSINRTSDGGAEFYIGPAGRKPADPFAPAPQPQPGQAIAPRPAQLGPEVCATPRGVLGQRSTAMYTLANGQTVDGICTTDGWKAVR